MVTDVVSPYFPQSPEKKRKPSERVSCIPFPPLRSTSFGLVQERLAHDPFRLLIAVTFLNKTRGSVALPVFYELMEHYPSPADLAAAKQENVVNIIQHLGLQNQRASTCINLAKAWLKRPPDKQKRYRVLHYPNSGDGKDIKVGEVIGENDERVAWEIGQLPGCGAYAMDSWRIFCRDELRGIPTGLPMELTEETKRLDLQREWATVLPLDKELRAYLRWRWLRNGWEWNPVTGERKLAGEAEMAKAGNGGVICEGEQAGLGIAEPEAKGSSAVKRELG
ncbi:methyl-CpG-binding domain protein 4, partial [Lecanoromycetidae sp. Uapishka_2]